MGFSILDKQICKFIYNNRDEEEIKQLFDQTLIRVIKLGSEKKVTAHEISKELRLSIQTIELYCKIINNKLNKNPKIKEYKLFKELSEEEKINKIKETKGEVCLSILELSENVFEACQRKGIIKVEDLLKLMRDSESYCTKSIMNRTKSSVKTANELKERLMWLKRNGIC